MASERRCNFKFGLTIGEIVTYVTIISAIITLFLQLEYGLNDVKAANMRTDERHLKDVEEIRHEFRGDTKEIKGDVKEIKRDIKRILRELR